MELDIEHVKLSLDQLNRSLTSNFIIGNTITSADVLFYTVVRQFLITVVQFNKKI